MTSYTVAEIGRLTPESRSINLLSKEYDTVRTITEDMMRSAWKRHVHAWHDMGRLCKAINAYTTAEHATYQRARRDFHTAKMTLREGLRQRGGTWDAGEGVTLAVNDEGDVKLLHDDYGASDDAAKLARYARATIVSSRRRYGGVAVASCG